jgi:hypothetical protein
MINNIKTIVYHRTFVRSETATQHITAVCRNGGLCGKLLVCPILLNFVVNEKSVHLSRH